MTPPLVSVLCPTRGRPKSLERALRSLTITASDPENFEFILRMDDDDPSYNTVTLPKATIITGEPRGYNGTNIYFTECAAAASGRWLWLWNDDALQVTYDWDTIIASYGDGFRTISPRTNMWPIPNQRMSIFPIIPKRWYEIFGYLSPHTATDTWIGDVAFGAGVAIEDDHRIFAFHDRADATGNNDDATRAVFLATYRGAADYWLPPNQAAIAHDVAILQRALA